MSTPPCCCAPCDCPAPPRRPRSPWTRPSRSTRCSFGHCTATARPPMSRPSRTPPCPPRASPRGPRWRASGAWGGSTFPVSRCTSASSWAPSSTRVRRSWRTSTPPSSAPAPPRSSPRSPGTRSPAKRSTSSCPSPEPRIAPPRPSAAPAISIPRSSTPSRPSARAPRCCWTPLPDPTSPHLWPPSPPTPPPRAAPCCMCPPPAPTGTPSRMRCATWAWATSCWT